MTEWIPLLQSLVWPVFIIGLLICFRGNFSVILTSIAARIRSADYFEAGPSGLKFGNIQLPPRADATEKIDTRVVDSLPHTIYMTHRAFRDQGLDQANQYYYRLLISLDADKPEMLDDVEKVVYHLHPTFKDPDRTVTDRRTSFGLRTAAWGEFNMTAEVHFRSEKPRLVIERYINFLPPSA